MGNKHIDLPPYEILPNDSKYDSFYKVILFGDAGSGKTQLFNRLPSNTMLPNAKSNSVVAFTKISVEINNKVIALSAWDCTIVMPSYCNNSFNSLSTNDFTRGAETVWLTVDPSKKDSLDNLEYWISKIRKELSPINIVLVRTKADLMKIDDDEQIKKIAYHNSCHWINTSAKTGAGIDCLCVATADALNKLHSVSCGYSH